MLYKVPLISRKMEYKIINVLIITLHCPKVPEKRQVERK